MMKDNKYIVIVLSIIIFGLVYIFSINSNPLNTSYRADQGVLNLSTWNANEMIFLSGEWAFFNKQLKHELNNQSNNESNIKSIVYKEVPHFWESDKHFGSEFGFGTYRLSLTGLTPNEVYAIHVMDEVTAYSLYANNEIIASNGIVGTGRESYRPEWQPKLALFNANDQGEAILEMEIANFEYYRGGFWNSPRISSVETMLSTVNREKGIELALFISILIMGLFNLAFFITNKNDKLPLFFALFCFSMSFRTLLIGQRLITDLLPRFNWHFLIRLEYLLGYLLLPFFGLFVIQLFNKKKYLIHLKRFFYVFIFFSFLITLILPHHVYTSVLELYKWIGLLFTIYFLYLLFDALKTKKSEAFILLFAVLGLFVAILKEMLIGGVTSWLPFATINFILCFTIITFQKFISIIKKNEMLEARIIIDPLTGLYNRNYLMSIENGCFENSDEGDKYLMFLDLDDFKSVNDNYGHKVGDFILQQAGERFKSVIRKSDILFRYGGDEFIIILTAKSHEEVENIAKRIIEATNIPFEKENMIYHIGVSIGIVKNEENMQSIDLLIKRSDEAMYEAKSAGSNRYVFYTH